MKHNECIDCKKKVYLILAECWWHVKVRWLGIYKVVDIKIVSIPTKQ
jgi:hypothetical protein